MEKVYLYKDSNGVYRVHPPVVVITGGSKVRFFNCTGVNLFVTVPRGVADANSSQQIQVNSQDRGDITTRVHGSGTNRGYNYTVETSGGIRAKGNSDPVLIIEN